VSKQMVFKSELKRLIGLRTFYIFIFIMAASAVFGVNYDLNIANFQRDSITMSSMLLGSAKTSAVVGSIAFAVFTLLEIKRDKKTRTALIISSCTDYSIICVPRLLAKAVVGLLSSGMSALSCFIVIHEYITESGRISLFLFSILFITLAAILYSELICYGLYMVCQRVELSLILYMGLLYMSLRAEGNYLLNWVSTNVKYYSDSFGNAQAMKLILWNRLLWLFISLSVFLIGLLCSRRYGYGIWKSILCNFKKWSIALSMCALILFSSVVYVNEPLFTDDPGPMVQEIENRERQAKGLKPITVYDNICSDTRRDKYLKILSCYPNISIDARNGTLEGYTRMTLEKAKEGKGYFCFQLARGLNIRKIFVNGVSTDWLALSESIYAAEIPDENGLTLEVSYGGTPQNVGYLDQGSPDYTISNEYVYLADEACMPVPCFYAINDIGYRRFKDSEVAFQSSLILPENFIPATTGETAEAEAVNNRLKKWTSKFSMQTKPFIMVNASPDYNVSSCVVNGKTLELYCSERDKNDAGFRADEIIASAMVYFTKWYGESPLDFSTLKLVERHINEDVKVADTNIIYIDEFVIRHMKSNNGYENDVGEIYSLVSQVCRLWWSDSVLSIREKTRGTHGKSEIFSSVFPDNVWGSSQLVEYCTYQYILDTYGKVQAKHIEDSWKTSVRCVLNNFYYQNPEYLSIVPERFVNEVINEINETRYKKLTPLKILTASRKNGENRMRDKIAVLARKFSETYDPGLIMEALEFTKEIEITKGDLADE
jgi:hypothetical protein